MFHSADQLAIPGAAGQPDVTIFIQRHHRRRHFNTEVAHPMDAQPTHHKRTGQRHVRNHGAVLAADDQRCYQAHG